MADEPMDRAYMARTLLDEVRGAEKSLAQYLVLARKEVEVAIVKKEEAERARGEAEKLAGKVATTLSDDFFVQCASMSPLLVLNIECIPREKLKTPPNISRIIPLINNSSKARLRAEAFLDGLRAIPAKDYETIGEGIQCSYIANSFSSEDIDTKPTRGNLLRLVLESAHEAKRISEITSRVTNLWQDHEGLFASEAEKLRAARRRLEKHVRKKSLGEESPVTRELRVPVCRICCEHPLGVALQCGHQTCTACSGRLQRCPVCRVAITTRIGLYY